MEPTNQQNQGTGAEQHTPAAGTTSNTGTTGRASSGSRSRSTQSAQSQANTTQPQGENQDQGNILNTALESGKKWLNESGVLDQANQLPDAAKEWGNKAWARVSGLSTTQKVVGGALLLAGVAYLTTRGKSKLSGYEHSAYKGDRGFRRGAWAGYGSNQASSRRNDEGNNRYGSSSYGSSSRVSSGSGDYGSSTRGYSSDRSTSVGSSSSYGGYGSNRADRGPSSSENQFGSGRNSAGGSRYGSRSSANSNEEDYDASL